MKNNKIIESELYKKIIDAVPTCTVDVLFFSRNKKNVLLFKRNNKPMKGVYFSCGGRLLKNEKLRSGAVRKVKEELGIDIDVDALIFGGVIDEIYDDSMYGDIGQHCVDVYYGYVLSERELNNIKLDTQHSTNKWFDVDDEALHPFIKEKIKQTLKNMQGK